MNPSFWCLNTDYEVQAKAIEPVTFSCELRKIIGKLQRGVVNKEGKINYEELKNCAVYTQYCNNVVYLSKLNLQNLSDKELKVFFINIYNSMAFHILMEKGETVGLNDKEFSSRYCYLIAGEFLSLNDIYHNILRAQKQLGCFGNKIEFLCDTDFRTHFALNSRENDYSSPYFYITLENFEDYLNVCTRVYFENNVKIDKDKKEVRMPFLFQTYILEFGATKLSLLELTYNFSEYMKSCFNDYKTEYVDWKLDFEEEKGEVNEKVVKAMLPVLNSFTHSLSSGSIKPLDITLVNDYHGSAKLSDPVLENKNTPKMSPKDRKGFFSFRISNDSNTSKENLISPKIVKPLTIRIETDENPTPLKYDIKSDKRIWDLKVMLAAEFLEEGYLPYEMVLKKSKKSDTELVNELELSHDQNKIFSDSTLYLSFDPSKKKSSKSSMNPKNCFCVGRSLKYVVSGEKSSFEIHFSDGNTNRCEVSKNIDVTFKKNFVIQSVQHSIEFDKYHATCYFKVLLDGLQHKQTYNFEVKINGEVCLEYDFVVLKMTPENLRIFLKEENCLYEILQNLESMKVEEINNSYTAEDIVEIISTVEKSKNTSLHLKLISLMTKYFEKGKTILFYTIFYFISFLSFK